MFFVCIKGWSSSLDDSQESGIKWVKGKKGESGHDGYKGNMGEKGITGCNGFPGKDGRVLEDKMCCDCCTVNDDSDDGDDDSDKSAAHIIFKSWPVATTECECIPCKFRFDLQNTLGLYVSGGTDGRVSPSRRQDVPLRRRRGANGGKKCDSRDTVVIKEINYNYYYY